MKGNLSIPLQPGDSVQNSTDDADSNDSDQPLPTRLNFDLYAAITALVGRPLRSYKRGHVE
ncbi:unnamed protein product [Dovyalis caffra]|uniref:Uncharacterized protein n=1 Tax=Dovyalis caffra TaxID=77055 RepID=A0AAV1R4V1_9ROSI|nr:unnamed protein product [Dovyalis caffra]